MRDTVDNRTRLLQVLSKPTRELRVHALEAMGFEYNGMTYSWQHTRFDGVIDLEVQDYVIELGMSEDPGDEIPLP